MRINLRGGGAVASLLVLAALAGCKPSLVGKWNGSMPGIGNATLEFKQDGTLAQTGTLPMMGAFEASGTYKVDGEKVHIDVLDLKAGGKSILSMLPAQVTSQFKQEATWKIEGDTLTMTRGGGSQTFTRAK